MTTKNPNGFLNGRKPMMWIIVILWSVCTALVGFAVGARSAGAMMERHLERGHPITVATIDRWLALEVRLTRIEALLQIATENRRSEP